MTGRWRDEADGQRGWVCRHGLPLLVLLGLLPLMVVTRSDVDVLWHFVVFPMFAFITAMLLRPAHVLVVPAIFVPLLTTFCLKARYAFEGGHLRWPDPGTHLMVVFAGGSPMRESIWAGRALVRWIRYL
jgi:hypothetical protein